jgi:DNA (cytosine-5)-methyltransferase 1
MLGQQSGATPRSVDQPVPTIATAGAISLIQPFIMQTSHTGTTGRGSYVWPMDEPLRTLTSGEEFALIQPYLIKYFNTGISKPVSEPLDTVTTKPRFGLVQPLVIQLPNGDMVFLDILFRMLQPHELAAAMSFAPDYKFSGTKEQVVKQIGNAVPVRTASRLIMGLVA